MKKIVLIILIGNYFINFTCTAQITQNTMENIDNYLNEIVKKGKSPSVQYILFDQNNILHNHSKGFADVLNKKNVNENTRYKAFSVTKTFTALAIMQLAEKGLFHIDESVRKYLPDFKYSKEITIRQLLSHSAGLPNPNPLSWIHTPRDHENFDRNEFFDKIL